MAITYKKIASVTVGAGGAANIEFTSIPGTYTDLILHASTRSNRTDYASDNLRMTFNNDTTGYTTRRLEGSGSAATSDVNTSTTSFLLGYTDGDTMTASTFASQMIYVPNYAGATNKSVNADGVTENNATFAMSSLAAGLWANTSAITSIKLFPQVGTLFKQYSTATLYGILKA